MVTGCTNIVRYTMGHTRPYGLDVTPIKPSALLDMTQKTKFYALGLIGVSYRVPTFLSRFNGLLY